MEDVESSSDESPMEENELEDSPLEENESEDNPMEGSANSSPEMSHLNEIADDPPSSWEDEDVEFRIVDNPYITRVRLPNRDKGIDVRMRSDDSDYVSHHKAVSVNACSTFDVIPDDLGDNRADQYPLAMTVLTASQRISVHRNSLFVLKLSNLHKNELEWKDEEDSDSDDDNGIYRPIVDGAAIRHPGKVNRVKVKSLYHRMFAASWSTEESVFIWDLSVALEAVNDRKVLANYNLVNKFDPYGNDPPPPYTYKFDFDKHSTDGRALEWSPNVDGMIASGDDSGSIYVWRLGRGFSWHFQPKLFKAHANSVTDIKWSPREHSVMVSCSHDRSIKFWDIRVAPDRACIWTKDCAHREGVRSISWSPRDPFLLSGGEDGIIKIWDLRRFGGDSIFTLAYHKSVTSLEWHPADRAVFAASGSEDHVTQWNMTSEKYTGTGELYRSDFPPQLVFVHRGQYEVGDVQWHKQMPGVLLSTSANGLHVFRTFKI